MSFLNSFGTKNLWNFTLKVFPAMSCKGHIGRKNRHSWKLSAVSSFHLFLPMPTSYPATLSTKLSFLTTALCKWKLALRFIKTKVTSVMNSKLIQLHALPQGSVYSSQWVSYLAGLLPKLILPTLSYKLERLFAMFMLFRHISHVTECSTGCFSRQLTVSWMKTLNGKWSAMSAAVSSALFNLSSYLSSFTSSVMVASLP